MLTQSGKGAQSQQRMNYLAALQTSALSVK